MDVIVAGATTLSLWAWLGSILFCAQGAYSKGRSQVLWLIGGILWGPLALLALAAFAPKQKKIKNNGDAHVGALNGRP